MLLTAFLSHFRPRWLVVAALCAALAYNVVPYLMLIPYRSDGRSADSAFWSQAVDYVRTHGAGGYRVEVVPTASHWEAYWVPKADIALARGWYRQLDEADNSVLYGQQLSGQEYRAWLRSVGVRYVVRPLTKLDFAGATGEAELLDSGRSGLVPVLRTSQVVVYELPRYADPDRIEPFADHDLQPRPHRGGQLGGRELLPAGALHAVLGRDCGRRLPEPWPERHDNHVRTDTRAVRSVGAELSGGSGRVSRDRRRAALLTG